MEFKLPFPTLQDLAVLEIAHSLMDLEVSYDTMVRNRANSLHDSLKKVDELEILNEQKCDIREVLKGTHDHLQNWYSSRRLSLYNHYSGRPKLQFDVFGCVDEEGMARDFLKKCHSDERVNNDLSALVHLLSVASCYGFLPDIYQILQKILKLRAEDSAVPHLEGPEFQIDSEDKLCLVYRFVNQQMKPMSSCVGFCDSFSSIHLLRSCFCVTLKCCRYNLELFELHGNLLQPSKRLPFVRDVITEMSDRLLVKQVVNIVNFLDSRHVFELPDTADSFFRCLLVWPFQEHFLPMLRQVEVWSELRFKLFITIVDKLDIMAFKDLLVPLWETISLDASLELSRRLTEPGGRLSVYRDFKDSLRKLLSKNALMYKRVATDLNLPPSFLQES